MRVFFLKVLLVSSMIACFVILITYYKFTTSYCTNGVLVTHKCFGSLNPFEPRIPSLQEKNMTIGELRAEETRFTSKMNNIFNNLFFYQAPIIKLMSLIILLSTVGLFFLLYLQSRNARKRV